MSKSIKKYIAAASIFFYLISGQGLPAYAQPSIAPVSLHGRSAASSMEDGFLGAMSGTSARQLARAPLMFPAHLGVTEEFKSAASPSQLPGILHLQTAHGGYEAQMALVRALNYLKKNQALDMLLLEGADEPLDPKLDRFFKNNAWNQQVAKERLKKGRMSGAAYFLMRQSDDSVKAFGVESSEDYRTNRNDFLTLIEQRLNLEAFLNKAESHLDRLFAERTSKKILDLRRQEKSFAEGRLDWASWIGQLKKTALADLNLDLEHVSSQKEWPSLLRFLWLSSMEPLLRTRAFPAIQAEKPDSIQAILKLGQGRRDDFHYGEVRIILEEWLHHKKTRGTEPVSAELQEAVKRVTLQNEIKPAALWMETDALTRRLMNDYAKTPAEIKLLKLDEDLKLLRGLLLAELSFQEYLKVLEREESLVPGRFIAALQRLSQTDLPLIFSGQEEGEDATGDLSSFDALFKTALRFYGGAKQREKKITENTIRFAAQSHAKWVVLVTGGFHSAGLRDELVREGLTYMRVTPRTRSEQGDYLSAASQDPRSVYRQVFMEHSLGGETRAHIEDAAVLPISRAALGRLGVDEAGFIANRTKILAAWHAMMGRAKDEEVMDQFNASAFSRQYGLQWEGGRNKSAFVRSEVRAEGTAVDLHKQIYAELHAVEEVLQHLPQGLISEFSRIQVLLAALYGGSVQLNVEQLTKKKNSHSHWEKRNYAFRWGLYALAEKLNFKNLTADQRKKVKTDMKQAVDQLEQFGIRVEQIFSSSVAGEVVSVGAALTHAPAFQNPFLQTFLGESDKMKSVSQSQSRFERAIEILTAFPAAKGKKLTPAETIYLRSFDHIFIPDFKMAKDAPFVVRVQHNRVRGPYKGGIRLVDAYTLVHDKHFKQLFDDLKTHLTLQELRYFLRKYILEETLPLSFGMTSKAAVANLPYGGGKGTMLVADVIETSKGDRRIEDLHRGHDATRYLFQLARGTARVLADSDTVSSNKDIPAADLNSGRYMDAMADEQIEVVYEALQPKLNELLRKRRHSLPPGDVAFIELLAEVPQYTVESVEKPLYLQLLTDYGTQLRMSKRRVPSWAKPLFEAAAAYTSKSEKLMGSIFRSESTGYGGIHVLKDIVIREKLSRSQEKPLLGMTAKLMGLGAVGAPAAEKMIEEGMVIKLISLGPLGAVSKAEGGFTKEEIILIRRMIAEKKDLVSLGQPGYEAPGLEYIEPEQVDSRLLESETDVFVLAAVENAIHVGNVGQARGKIFLELANGAITNEAYDRLVQNYDTMVIPDTLANAGGVTVSYYEWLQNLKNESWDRDAIIQRLEKQLSGGVARVAQVRETYNTDWRTAADVLMILEVLAARRAEKNKPVRSKNKRSEVRVDTDASTYASNFRTRRSEVRAAHDQIGGFSYLDLVKSGKLGVFTADELEAQVGLYLGSSASQGVFAGAVMSRGQDRENPEFVTWQSLVTEEGRMDAARRDAFLREKVKPLTARKAVSFEVHQFLYTLRDDEVEMIRAVGGKKTGLLLAIFPEKTGGDPDAPGGRGQRPWDQPRPFSPQGGQALKAESQPIESAPLFGRERETADSEEILTVKKDQGRSEVRAASAKLLPEEITAARTEEFFAIRDELLSIFSRYKKAKGDGKEAEQTRLLAQARGYANILPSFIGEIRSGDGEEQKVLDSYASMASKTRQSEAKTLGESMRGLTPRFVEQWRIYKRKGVLEADKQTANAALNSLNAEVVRLAKRRLKLQLLQFKNALEAEPLHQGTIFALLMSITDLYQRIRYEYQWRTFRSAGSIKTARLPMMGALGLVRDNLPYQSEPLLRVESREEGGVIISQIVWKFKPVQGSQPALIPEMTAMTFPDFPTALRGKEHALESQEQDYAALADHDFILQGVKDTLDWYVKSREPLPEETSDQLIATLMAVQTGPNGRFGLARRRARHYTPGALKIQANVLEKPGPKIALAITNIETGTIEKLKEASGAIEAAQLWTRARREYIERITAPATHRKRDYAYALMRDALIQEALRAIKTDVAEAVIGGTKPSLEKARAAEQNLRGLEQTYFRFIPSGSTVEPAEITLYKNLKRELRGIISILAGLVSDVSRPALPKSAQPTAKAVDKKINGVLTLLTAADDRRKTSLSRSEVRSAPSDTEIALSQDIASLQDDLRAAIEFTESQIKPAEPLTAVDDLYGVFQGTPIAPSDETVPPIHPGLMDDFLERQKAAVFYFEFYEQTAGSKGAYAQEFRESLSLIESQIQKLQGFIGRSEVRDEGHEKNRLVTKELAEAFADSVYYAAIAGRPGAGKGTVTGRFIQEINALLPPDKRFEVLVTGDWFRGVTRLLQGKAQDGDDDHYGAVVDDLPSDVGVIMASGDMVSDEVTTKFFNAVLRLPAFQGRRILFDGFPRTTGQLDLVKKGELFPVMDLFVLIDTTEETAVNRILGGNRGRDDDKEASIRKRMAQFAEHTAPMMEDLRGLPETIALSGETKADEVYSDFLEKLNKRFRSGPFLAVRAEVRAGGANEFLNRTQVLPENLQRAIRQWAHRLYLEGKGHPKAFTDAGFKKLKGINAAKYQVDRIANIIKDVLRNSKVHYSDVADEITLLLAQALELPGIKDATRTNLRIISEYPITLIWLLHSIYSPKVSEFVLPAALRQDAERLNNKRRFASAYDDDLWSSGVQRALRDADVEIPIKRSWFSAEAKRRLLRLPRVAFEGSWRTLVRTGPWLVQFRQSPVRVLKALFGLGLRVLTSGWFWKIVVWAGLPLGFGYGVYRSYFIFTDYVTDGHPDDVSELMMAVNNGLFVLALAIPVVLFTAILWNLRTHSWFPGGARKELGAPPVERLSKDELRERGHTGGPESDRSARSEVRTALQTFPWKRDANPAETIRKAGSSKNIISFLESEPVLDLLVMHLFQTRHLSSAGTAEPTEAETPLFEAVRRVYQYWKKGGTFTSPGELNALLEPLEVLEQETRRDRENINGSLAKGLRAKLLLMAGFPEAASEALNAGWPHIDQENFAFALAAGNVASVQGPYLALQVIKVFSLLNGDIQLLKPRSGSGANEPMDVVLTVYTSWKQLFSAMDEYRARYGEAQDAKTSQRYLRAVRNLDERKKSLEETYAVQLGLTEAPQNMTARQEIEWAGSRYRLAFAPIRGAYVGWNIDRLWSRIPRMLAQDLKEGVKRRTLVRAAAMTEHYEGFIESEARRTMGNIDYMHQAVERLREARTHLNLALKKLRKKESPPGSSPVERRVNSLVALMDQEIKRGYPKSHYSATDYYTVLGPAVAEFEEILDQMKRKDLRGADLDRLLSLSRKLLEFLNQDTQSVSEREENRMGLLNTEGYQSVTLYKRLKRFEHFLLKQTRVSQPGSKPSRSEVRYAPASSIQTRVEAAEFLEGLFLPDDLVEWDLNQTMPAAAARYLKTPRVRSDLDLALEQAAKLIAESERGSGEWMDRFPGETLRDQEKKTYVIGPELLRRYGPVLFAVEQAAPAAARFIVLAEDAEDALKLEKLVTPINSRLAKNRRLMMKTPEQAKGLLKADTLRGLGLGEADAELLRKIIPDYVPLNVFELDTWISQMPGLTALVQQFQALAALSASA